jgi:cytochrome bd-type quinol oxidase subunit 2
MDFSAFFGVVATVDFALLGLWWVAIQARPDLRSRKSRTSEVAYLVSMQFAVPGTAALLAQVDPQLTGIWRVTFAIAGLSGLASILLVTPPSLATEEAKWVRKMLRLGAAPLYGIIAILAMLPDFPPAAVRMSALQLEAVIFCVMAFVGAQTAWALVMIGAPDAEQAPDSPR